MYRSAFNDAPAQRCGVEEDNMITITDNTKSVCWELSDSTGKFENVSFPYDASGPFGYDRIRVLKQIVDVYSILTGCKNQGWQTEGKVFTLS
jgi:hypothetical protein